LSGQTLATQRQRGFTLLEILVALAILGLSAGTMMAALNTAANTSRAAADQATALSIAQSLLAAQTAAPGPFGETTGTTPQGYHWQLITKPLPSTAAVGLYWVQVQVARTGAPVTLTTLETGPSHAAP
jgi:general secretion pathway protein I